MEVRQQPAAWEPAAPEETPGVGGAMVAVERIRGARVPAVARAQVVALGWLGRDKEVKRAAVVKRAKQVKRVQAVPGVDGAMPMPLRIYWIDVEGGAATLIVNAYGRNDIGRRRLGG